MQWKFKAAIGAASVAETPVLFDRGVFGWIDKAQAAVFYGRDDRRVRRLPLKAAPAFVVRLERRAWLLATTKCLIVKRRGKITAFTIPDARERFNDILCESGAQAWMTTAPDAPGAKAALLRFDGHHLRVMDDTLVVGNGIARFPDDAGILVVDTGARVIYRYVFDAQDAGVVEKRVWADLGAFEGKPDGIAVGPDRCLYCAMWDGSGLLKLDVHGRVIEMLPLPVKRPTSLLFSRDEVIITTASVGLSPADLAEAPLSGQLLIYTL